MANYTQSVDFSVKDSLPTGNVNKKILGADVDGELSAISVAIASKLDDSTGTLTSVDAADSLYIYDSSASAVKKITLPNFLYSGCVRQVVTATYSTDDTVSTTSPSNTGLLASITLGNSASIVIVQVFAPVAVQHDTSGTTDTDRWATWQIYRTSGTPAEIAEALTGRVKDDSNQVGRPSYDSLFLMGQETPGAGTHTYRLRCQVPSTALDAVLRGSTNGPAMMIIYEVEP